MFTRMRRLAVCLALAGLALTESPGAQAPMEFPPPLIQAKTVKLSTHAYVIPDPETTLVPNVGIVVGSKATLVVDTGMGNRNGRTILAEVAKVSRNTTLYLVTGPVSRIGRFDVTLRATGGGHSAPFSVVLQVTPPPPPSTSPPAATTTLPVIFNPGNSNVTQPTVQQPTVPSSQPNTSPTIRIGPS